MPLFLTYRPQLLAMLVFSSKMGENSCRTTSSSSQESVYFIPSGSPSQNTNCIAQVHTVTCQVIAIIIVYCFRQDNNMQKLPSTMELEDNMILLAKSDTWYEPHDRFASGLMCFLKYQYQKDSVVIFFIFSSVSFSFTKVALNIYLPLISPQNLVSSNSSAIR
jgi:hypothetical protein